MQGFRYKGVLFLIKTYAKLKEMDICDIKPHGWIRRYLEIQKDGLTGHLEAAGYPFDRMGWAMPDEKTDRETKAAEEWWPYEQTGYWIDGMAKCGYLLDDQALIRKAGKHIDYVLEHPDADGYLGPAFMKEPAGWNRWPHAVFFRALMTHYSATHDARVLPALKAHYLSGTSPHSGMREVCNLEEILWTYERTGDTKLLEHAKDAYKAFNRLYGTDDASLSGMLSGRKSTEHGVTFQETAKLGALLYLYTGYPEYLEATRNAYRKLDRDQLLIDGVCSSSEALRGKDPLDSHETCDIADYTWSVGYLLMATGDADYADRIEKACFNAAPGAVRSDFKGLQYFSCPNQVVADSSSNHNLFFRGSKWMSYRPNPGTECCPGSVNRIMPNFAARMWMRDADGGLAAVLYGPCCVTAKVGASGTKIRIVEETFYPFSERIDFRIRTPEPVRFPFKLRIPGWCADAKLAFNGTSEPVRLQPGTFFTLERIFCQNDRISLVLPMQVRISRWPNGGIGIERGPLAYALRIEEDWKIDREETKCTEDFPAWNLYPASPWNYALQIDEENPEGAIAVIRREPTLEPWSIRTAPIELKIPARRIKGWNLERKRRIISERNDTGELKTVVLKGNFRMTPELPDPQTVLKNAGKRTETVTLVPYGCTKLRISVFPHVFPQDRNR